MTLLLTILRYNDIMAPVFALIGNFVLLYLILTVNKQAMKNISFVLLPSCLMDMILSISTFTMAPQVFNIKFTAYVIMGSPLYAYGFVAASYVMWVYGSCVVTSMNAVCIPFYLRYLVICRNVKVTKKHLILPYTILFAAFLLLFAGFIWCFPTISESDTEIREPTMNDFWTDEYTKGPVFVAANIESFSFISFYSFIISTSVCSYTLVLVFSLKIKKSLQSHINNFTGTKILSREIHRTLIIQAIGPLLVANLPILSLIAMIFLHIENFFVSSIFCLCLGWIPVVNPLAAILIITPYKNKLQNMFGIKEKPTISFIPSMT